MNNNLMFIDDQAGLELWIGKLAKLFDAVDYEYLPKLILIRYAIDNGLVDVNLAAYTPMSFINGTFTKEKANIFSRKIFEKYGFGEFEDGDFLDDHFFEKYEGKIRDIGCVLFEEIRTENINGGLVDLENDINFLLIKGIANYLLPKGIINFEAFDAIRVAMNVFNGESIAVITDRNLFITGMIMVAGKGANVYHRKAENVDFYYESLMVLAGAKYNENENEKCFNKIYVFTIKPRVRELIKICKSGLIEGGKMFVVTNDYSFNGRKDPEIVSFHEEIKNNAHAVISLPSTGRMQRKPDAFNCLLIFNENPYEELFFADFSDDARGTNNIGLEIRKITFGININEERIARVKREKVTRLTPKAYIKVNIKTYIRDYYIIDEELKEKYRELFQIANY